MILATRNSEIPASKERVFCPAWATFPRTSMATEINGHFAKDIYKMEYMLDYLLVDSRRYFQVHFC